MCIAKHHVDVMNSGVMGFLYFRNHFIRVIKKCSAGKMTEKLYLVVVMNRFLCLRVTVMGLRVGSNSI